MPVTRRSDLIYLDILQEAIQAAFAGRVALYGTGAAVINTSLPAMGPSGRYQGGDTIKVPYFDTIGELDDVTEGVGLIPRKLSQTEEHSTVIHSGVAGELTSWAMLSAMFSDPYKELARQFVEAYIRRIDLGLITQMNTSALSLDVSALAGGAAQIGWDQMVDATQLWSDEQDDPVLMIVDSYVYGDMRKLKDAHGLPLLTETTRPMPEGGPTTDVTRRFGPYPVKVSNRLTTTGSGASTVHTSAFAKKGALAAWINGTPSTMEDTDILTDSQVKALHVYHVEHLYKRPPNRTKCGTVLLKTLASTHA
jgi:hypothetical protein